MPKPLHSWCWSAGRQWSWGPAGREAWPPYLGVPCCSSPVLWLWERVQGMAEQQDHEGTLLRLLALLSRAHTAATGCLVQQEGQQHSLLHLKAQQNETFETLITRTIGLLGRGRICVIKTAPVLMFSLNKDRKQHCNSDYVQVMGV